VTAVIVVPVLGRPERIGPLVDSIRDTTDSRILFVCSPDDQDATVACNQTGEDVIVVPWQPGRADFARKTNLAYRESTEDWIFCGATDLRFRRRWLDYAAAVGERSGAGVVGTQDMGNALVKRGKHATHPLIRRTYIEEYGGTFDGTGEIYSEQYDHQYVDLELVEVAKLRDQWAFAKQSIVEHMHPNWRKGEWDAVYEKAFAHAREDRGLYVRRMRQFNQLMKRQASHQRRAAL
jgi:hypothetical protein